MFVFSCHPHILPDISFSHPCFSGCFSCFSFASFSFSLITLYLPLSTHRLRLPPLWLSFIGSKPHFCHSTYTGRPFSLQMPSFCRIKALVQNQFPLLSIVFFSPFPIRNSCRSFLPLKPLFTALGDKGNRFSSFQKIGTRT